MDRRKSQACINFPPILRMVQDNVSCTQALFDPLEFPSLGLHHPPESKKVRKFKRHRKFLWARVQFLYRPKIISKCAYGEVPRGFSCSVLTTHARRRSDEEEGDANKKNRTTGTIYLSWMVRDWRTWCIGEPPKFGSANTSVIYFPSFRLSFNASQSSVEYYVGISSGSEDSMVMMMMLDVSEMFTGSFVWWWDDTYRATKVYVKTSQ